jgi:hypothetical protein
MKRRKKGHSNVREADTEPYSEGLPHVASIPLIGGASPDTTRELPPLALRIGEWKTIGLKMGWFEQVYLDALIGD